MEKNSENDLLSFLKIDSVRANSVAGSLMLKEDDIIVAIDGIPFFGSSEKLNETLRENKEKQCIITIARKDYLFEVGAFSSLGVKFKETTPEEKEHIDEVFKEHDLENIDSFIKYEIYRDLRRNYKTVDTSPAIMSTILPPVWLMHQRLYAPLALLVMSYILLYTISPWLFLIGWILVTVYMSKSATNLLRSSALMGNSGLWMIISANNLTKVQKIIRSFDPKAKFSFSLVGPPIDNEEEKEKQKDNVEEAVSTA